MDIQIQTILLVPFKTVYFKIDRKIKNINLDVSAPFVFFPLPTRTNCCFTYHNSVVCVVTFNI